MSFCYSFMYTSMGYYTYKYKRVINQAGGLGYIFVIKAPLLKMNSNSEQQYESSSQSDSQSNSPVLNNLAPDADQIKKQQKIEQQHGVKRQQKNSQQVVGQSQEIRLASVSLPRMLVPAQVKPRLIIDKIVLQNFKSYADTQSIGPFHENFTSVVGPNGSGKSNLIESMLFIFGYKANWMRLKSLNQLIHKSATMGQIQRASVQVKFKKVIQYQNGTIDQIPHESFTLRRTVRGNGTSKYQINGHESTQGSVKTKLKQQGIDLNNNRFLILQGQVEQISQMKSKSGDREKPGLLQYLQDIIGSSIYIEQIQQSVVQYNMNEEKKHQKGQLMKLAELELKNMSKGKQEAIKYVKKQRQIYQIHNILQQVIISNNNYDAKEYKEKLVKVQAQRDRIINEEKQKLKKQAERIREIKKTKMEIENIERELNRENENMAKMVASDKNINQELSFKSEDLVKYDRRKNQLVNQLEKIMKESDEVKENLPICRDKLVKLKAELEGMEKQLQKYDKPELQQQLKGLQVEHKKTQYEIKNFQEKHRQVQKRMDQKFKRNQKNEVRSLQLNKKLQQQQQTHEKIIQCETQASKIAQSLSADLQKISNSRRQLTEQLERISLNLKQQQNQKKQSSHFNDMFQKIMQQNIPGVIGRLGDLGTVQKQYDQIITTCCSRLDNIVVQHMQAAQAVLNFLKASKIGRITCIILDKLDEQYKYMDRQWNNLPNSVRLFDKIKPVVDKVRVAFYFALSDTIYCENSQLGMQYSMKDERNRRRVISKKPHGSGYIIYELNGLMNGCNARTGGFTVKAKTKMRAQDGGAETKELERKKGQLMESISGLQEKFRNVKKQYENVQKDLEEVRREKRKLQSSLNETKQQLEDLKRTMNKSVANTEEQRRKLQKQLESIANHLDKLQDSKREIASKMARVEKQQRENQNQAVIRLRDSYKISKQQYNLLDKDIQKKVAVLETTVKRVNQIEKSKAEVAKKMDMLQREIVKLKKQRDDVEIKATETMARIKAGEDRIQVCKKQEEKLKVMFEQQQKQVKQSKMKIDKAKEQVQLCLNKLKTFEAVITEAQSQLKKQRETYRQLSATYDFLQQLDSIQYMNIQDIKRNNQAHNKSIDTSAILNQSIQMSNPSNASMTKIFPLERLLEVSPFEDLPEEKLDAFLLFTDKMRTMLITESENLKKMSGSNLQIISEYRAKFTEFKKKHQEYEQVRLAQVELKKLIEQLKEKRLQAFREGFGVINSKLKQVYQLLTRGGDAELQLIDSLDPFSDGINFSVRPPKKAWKQINKLSGGEKTLSSLSLIFALHYYKPTPLYFMDQIDAALDFKNVSIVAEYIKRRTKDAQFIIISLRNNMFQLADKLVGVYKTHDKTKIVHFVPARLRRGGEKENLDANQH